MIGQSDDLFSRICICSSATNRQGKKHPLNILCQDLKEDHDKKLSSPSFALNIPGIYINDFRRLIYRGEDDYVAWFYPSSLFDIAPV